MSATETMNAEWADRYSITRLWAEYQTLAPTALRGRYDNLITTRSGLSIEQADQVRRSPAYGALVAALRDAEARGHNVTTALPRLVDARTLADADDVAAVLHERVDHWVHTTPVRRPVVPDRIVGLIPKVDAAEDPDLQQALQERQARIERRTRELSEQAVRSQQPWVVQLGTPPTDPARREIWYRNVDTLAAYYERWNDTGGTTLGRETPGSPDQESQRRLAEAAMCAARQLRDHDTPGVHQRERSLGRWPTRGGPEL